MKYKNKFYPLSRKLWSVYRQLKNGKVEVSLNQLGTIGKDIDVPISELVEMVKESADREENIAQLRYRIIGYLQNQKRDTTYIG